MAAQDVGGSDRWTVDEKESSEREHTADGENAAADARLAGFTNRSAAMSKYQVTVTTVPDNIVSLVKSLRLVADLGLKDAKALADFLRKGSSEGCVLVAGVDQEVADHVARLLNEAGGQAIVRESSIAAPMLLCPKANEKYGWHWFRGSTPTE